VTPPRYKILLVEGRDDREVVFQFCNHHGIDNKTLFTVEAKDGLESLLDDLRLRPRGSASVIGVIVDADADPKARWHQLARAIQPEGYALPDDPEQLGTILPSPRPNRPRLGIWMMPDNRTTGMLEDFLLQLTRDGDPLVTRAHRAIDEIPANERRFATAHRSKAAVHTWLAWQEEPGTALGQAITKRYLDPTRSPALAFRAWLLGLFAPDAPRPRALPSR
jgi:hypothetical protein